MSVLVTGAGGFCGRHLTSFLRDQGVKVHTLSPGDSIAPDHHRIIDITDADALARVLKLIQPDYIFHLAGIACSTDPALFYRVNTQYAACLLYAMERTGLDDRPVLLIGTSAEYGIVSKSQLPISEDLPPHPYNHYGISKLAQTFEGLAASRSGRPVVIVRPFNIIGRGMPEYLVVQSFAKQIIRIMEGQIAPVIEVGNLRSSRDFIDVSDVVRIYWQIIQKPAAYGEIINICSGRPVIMDELLSKLIELSGISIEARPNPSYFKPIDIPEHYGSTEKLQRIIGFASGVSLDVSLRCILKELDDLT